MVRSLLASRRGRRVAGTNDWFNVQTGPADLLVTTQGGPYQLEITSLVAPRELPADTRTPVGFEAPGPGQYISRLVGEPASTATLNVCQPGSC
jgi:hypothetical protein